MQWLKHRSIHMIGIQLTVSAAQADGENRATSKLTIGLLILWTASASIRGDMKVVNLHKLTGD